MKPVEAMRRAIMLAVQGHDLGRALPNGDFETTVAQIELLGRVCDAAALAALRALRENVTEGMVDEVEHASQLGGIWTAKTIFEAMCDRAAEEEETGRE